MDAAIRFLLAPAPWSRSSGLGAQLTQQLLLTATIAALVAGPDLGKTIQLGFSNQDVARVLSCCSRACSQSSNAGATLCVESGHEPVSRADRPLRNRPPER